MTRTSDPPAPLTLRDFEWMRQRMSFDDDDLKYLRLSHALVQDQADAILDVWYGFVVSNPHLSDCFSGRGGQRPLAEYLIAARPRFARWIFDTALAEYDQGWLDHQHEVALQHERARNHGAEGTRSTDVLPFRDLFTLVFPVTFTLRPFLAKKGQSAEVVDRMHAAWMKSCLLQLTLWAHPHLEPGAAGPGGAPSTPAS